MSDRLATLLRQHGDDIIREWADVVYSERRIELSSRLSYEHLVDHMPDSLQELSRLIREEGKNVAETVEATRRLRAHAQVRFYQGILLDEVARELMLFRQVIDNFLWRECLSARQGDFLELREALWRAHRFIDEMIAQAVVVYAASMRPPFETRTSVWPPPRRRRTDFPEHDER